MVSDRHYNKRTVAYIAIAELFSYWEQNAPSCQT